MHISDYKVQHTLAHAILAGSRSALPVSDTGCASRLYAVELDIQDNIIIIWHDLSRGKQIKIKITILFQIWHYTGIKGMIWYSLQNNAVMV